MFFKINHIINLKNIKLHLAEERSNFEIVKKRENEYLTEIEDIRIERNRFKSCIMINQY